MEATLEFEVPVEVVVSRQPGEHHSCGVGEDDALRCRLVLNRHMC